MIAGEWDAGSSQTAPRRRWLIVVLLFILVLDVWYRAATFAPSITQATRLPLWPAATGPSEPLDCDEAAYAYIGHRLLEGDVMYRDLTENKPPLGYWLYALAVKIGGYNELAIRLLPIPFPALDPGDPVLDGAESRRPAGRMPGPPALRLPEHRSVPLRQRIEHGTLHEPVRGGIPGFLPADMEQRSAVAACRRRCLPGSGCAGQAGGNLARGRFHRGDGAPKPARGSSAAPKRAVMARRSALFRAWPGAGRALAALELVVQGASSDAYTDILRYGRALATDTLPEPGAPSALVRWLTGNADPSGTLPWPFGSTNYLVWWGTGSWPLWLAAIPCLIYFVLAPSSTAGRRLAAAWTIAAALQVVLPGLYWPHYYLLATPGIALVAAVSAGDCLAVLFGARRGKTRPRTLVWATTGTLGLTLAIGGTMVIQVRSYLLVPPQELTVRYKGGGQWVALRALGRELARRSAGWEDPRLYVWGWQSPLHFYSKLDGVTRHFFVDNLLRDQAERDHPLIKPRIAEIMRALRERPPALIFAGYKPFPELRAFLMDGYLPSHLVPSGNGLGLWIDRKHFGAFEGISPAQLPPHSS